MSCLAPHPQSRSLAETAVTAWPVRDEVEVVVTGRHVEVMTALCATPTLHVLVVTGGWYVPRARPAAAAGTYTDNHAIIILYGTAAIMHGHYGSELVLNFGFLGFWENAGFQVSHVAV